MTKTAKLEEEIYLDKLNPLQKLFVPVAAFIMLLAIDFLIGDIFPPTVAVLLFDIFWLIFNISCIFSTKKRVWQFYYLLWCVGQIVVFFMYQLDRFLNYFG